MRRSHFKTPGEAAPEFSGALTFVGSSLGPWSETTLDTVSGPYPWAKVYQFTDPQAIALLRRKIGEIKASWNRDAFAITQAFRNSGRLIGSRYPAGDVDADHMYMHDSQYCDHGLPAASVQSYIMLPKTVVEATAVDQGSTGVFLFWSPTSHGCLLGRVRNRESAHRKQSPFFGVGRPMVFRRGKS